jgi:transcriptional regulator with XRE-family HTH domain
MNSYLTMGRLLVGISKFLREKRLSAGLSQGDVAKKLGYQSAQFVSNWERNLCRPPVETLRKIAQIYNIDPDQMFEIALESSIEDITADLTAKFFKYGKVS